MNRISLNCLFCLIAAIHLTACSPTYVLRAAWEEARILSRRRPISDVARDANTDSVTRRKLDLVLQARTFADQELGLNTGRSFTTYSYVDSDTLLMVLSAARKDRFEAYTWWFPIVGRMPYKGFFDFDQAHAAAAALDRMGYDTYVRPSGAFSTLGWFNDPVLNTILRYNDVGLASTVIHELTHNTIFIPGHVAFNESFANFVGDRGAIVFFCNRDGPDSRECRFAQDSWQDNITFSQFLNAMLDRLDTVYRDTSITVADRVQRRDVIFAEEKQRFATDVRPRLRTTAFRDFHTGVINNATLIGTRLYYDRLELFDAVFAKAGNDLIASIAVIRDVAEDADDPFNALQQWVNRR